MLLQFDHRSLHCTFPQVMMHSSNFVLPSCFRK